jgi:hypothetical protein
MYYSASKNGDKINVYAESTGSLKIQNISGYVRYIYIGFVGSYLPLP